MNFIIRIYSQSGTICSFVEPFLTTYSTESSDFGNYEILSIGSLIFEVENGEINNIFSTKVDSNQVSLFE